VEPAAPAAEGGAPNAMSRRKPMRHRVPAPVVHEAQPGRSRLFTLALVTWWIGGYGLVMYGAIADRGPFAFLIDWPNALFGGANMVLGALAGAVFVFWGPPLLAHLFLRLCPNSPLAAAFKQRMSLAMMSRGQAADVARSYWERLDDTARRALLRRRRNGALICAVVCVAGSWGVATYIRVSANAHAGRPLVQLALQARAVSLDGASRWVQVTNATALTDASIARDYAIRGTAHRDVYTPLVPPDWHTGGRIFLVEEEDTYPADRDAAAANPPGPIEGRFRWAVQDPISPANSKVTAMRWATGLRFCAGSRR
jgi:hypothetical protein